MAFVLTLSFSVMRAAVRLASQTRCLSKFRFYATKPPWRDLEKKLDPKFLALALGGGGLILASYVYQKSETDTTHQSAKTTKATKPPAKTKKASKPPAQAAKAPTPTKSDWPVYSRDEVASHTTPETGIWVTYLDGVYDITKFVKEHPGGDKILLAAGAGLEPFWDLYAVHKNEEVQKILATLRIGSLHAHEVEDIESDDPFATDPPRSPELVVRSAKPFNAESPFQKITQNFVTPNEDFYIRNHLPVPVVDVGQYKLSVTCPDKKKTLSLTYDELKKKYKPVTITAAIQCAGNRRDGINKVRKTRGLEWNLGAISNARWTGVRLRDVLQDMGLDDESRREFKHVIFEGLDQDPTGAYYGASIPIDKAMDKDQDVILAYEMNGQPLPRDHGYPIRAVVPGERILTCCCPAFLVVMSRSISVFSASSGSH